jgi:hypothetical protein
VSQQPTDPDPLSSTGRSRVAAHAKGIAHRAARRKYDRATLGVATNHALLDNRISSSAQPRTTIARRDVAES